MPVSGNFKFSLYLRESWLNEQERFNLERIFSALLPERQVEIIDHWPKYLDKLLEIKQYADDERKRNVANAFERIEKLVSEAELRAEEARKRTADMEAEFRLEAAGAEEYERRRKLEALKNVGRAGVTGHTDTVERSKETKPLEEDPLADFL